MRHRPSPHVSRRSRATKRKRPRPNRRGLAISRVCWCFRRATRAKIQSPMWRIFWISARGGSSAMRRYRGARARCQRSRRGDSRGRNLCGAYTARSLISPKIHHDPCTRYPRPLQILRPPGRRRPRPHGAGGRVLFAARAERRRQDHDLAHGGGPAAARRGLDPHLRHRCAASIRSRRSASSRGFPTSR